MLQLIVLALFLALVLGPFVEFLHRRRVPRWLAILLVYLGLLVSIVAVGLVAVPPIVREINAGVRQLPVSIAKLRPSQTFRQYDNKYKDHAEARS